MAKPRRGGGGAGGTPKGREKKPDAAVRKEDVYEAEVLHADEELHAEKYDRVDNFEYQMPSDFEDEDIDDEMAFTEEDKKMFGHLFDDAGPAGGAGGDDDSDGGLLSSGESEDAEDDEEDGWSEEEEQEKEEGTGGRKRRRQADELDELFGGQGGSSDEEPEEPDSEDEEDAEGGSDGDGEEEEARHRAMLEAVTSGGAAERRRRQAKEVVVTEAYPESAYNLPASTAGGELTVADLIAGLGDSKGKLGAARKALERMERKAAPVSAPLPGPIKQRQERKAGYEESKKEADKWLPIVKANREAPTLRFTADKSAVTRVTTTAALAAQHRPETDMETEVAALLEKAGAHSARAVAEAEEALAMKALSVEEVRERQNRLARMRALLFYHESKAKRLKKIKSKEYRRKLKKTEKRKALEAGEDGGADQLRLMEEQAEFDRAKERLTLKHKNTSRWVRRALRRGQTLIDDGTRAAVAEQLRLGEELRQRVNRMKGKGGSDSDASTSASDEDSDGSGDEGGAAPDGGFAGPRAGRGMGSRAKAAALELLEGGAEEGEAPSKGLFALPFMKRAMERRKLEAQQEAQQMLAELEDGDATAAAAAAAAEGTGRAGRLAFTGTGVDQRQQWERVAQLEAAALDDDSDMASDEDEDVEAKAARLGRRLGLQQEPASDGDEPEGAQRQRGAAGAAGGPAGSQQEAAAEPVAGRGAVAVTDGPISVDLPAGTAAASGTAGRRGGGGGAAASNGVLEELAKQQRGGAQQQDWLFAGKQAPGAGAKARGKGASAAGGVSIGPASAAERQQDGAAPAAAQQGEGGEAAPQPTFVRSKAFQGARPGYVFKQGLQGVGYYLDGAEAVKAAKAAKQRLKKEAAGERRRQQEQAGGAQGAHNGAAASDSEDECNMKPVQGLSQDELIRRAFAGDDVQAEFAAAKASEVEGELPQEEVPGMLPGWGTWAGQQREPKWVVDAKKKAEQRKAAAAANRKDAKLQYVVISEKWDKKSSKYKTPSVPFPFDSKDTYERAMRQPLGPEYNTDVSFRNMTRPAVLKDAGVIIEPIRFSKAMATYDEQVPKNAKRAAVTTIAGGMPKKAKKVKR